MTIFNEYEFNEDVKCQALDIFKYDEVMEEHILWKTRVQRSKRI